MKQTPTALLTAILVAGFLVPGCATRTSRSDFDNDCDYAKARYEEAQESVRLYYALGQTSLAEMAIAERRLKKAKQEVEAACGEEISDQTP